MQTLLGFWCFEVDSAYISRTHTVLCCDDGFGNLIPSLLPVHTILSLDLT